MDRDYELQTHQAEDRHWWYRGRRTVIENVIAGMRLPARGVSHSIVCPRPQFASVRPVRFRLRRRCSLRQAALLSTRAAGCLLPCVSSLRF